ncbi:MAG: GntR family transcriptional regulator [Parvularcula sp.]|jgi:DNA-binding GntR family transcriptional regulator|nr:GntR family transcriptional regulator [Parvularcula sp.]
MDSALPLYRRLAERLRRRITGGQLAEGSPFPTEMEICESEGVSRHTAREALRILSEDGLIERRRGAGTIVVRRERASFAQSIGDYQNLLQYARDTEFVITATEEAEADEAESFGLEGPFRRYRGVRRVHGQPPQAALTVFIRADIDPRLTVGSAVSGSIAEGIEARLGLRIDRVTQRMEAVGLPREAAVSLGLETGSPALRTVRRYRAADDDILLLSESFHPAGRFAYEMRLSRA